MDIKGILSWLRPDFWDFKIESQTYEPLFNYRRIWVLSVLMLFAVSLVPLSVLFVVDFQLGKKTIKSESVLRTVRQTSNTRRTLTYFIQERMDALSFIVQETDFSSLNDRDKLEDMLDSLKVGFGGFVDVGVLLPNGEQVAYAGPFELRGKNYSEKDWFKKTVKNGVYISDVFLGYRNVPHMIVAIKGHRSNGDTFILRGTLDIKKLINIITGLELSDSSDAFIINQDGVLQTPSKFYGQVLDKIDLPVPEFSKHTQSFEARDVRGKKVLVSYAYIADSPYILEIVRPLDKIMHTWTTLRQELYWFFLVSILLIILVILGISTYMVNKVFYADQTRMGTLHQVEHTNRLASIGRLAAGVAHEINNPLAVINEKAGLLKDILTWRKENQVDPRVVEIVDEIISSVDRSGAITKQLLGFARHLEVEVQEVDLYKLVHEVLDFFKKESEYRNIVQEVDISEDVPNIVTDRGQLEQVFMNLVNNAYQAIGQDGRLIVQASAGEDDWVEIRVEDTGCGIPKEDIKKIFEPFYSTRKKKGGTGLGLSITYGLVKKLGGKVYVQSEVNEGTAFNIKLPVKMEGQDEGSFGG